MKKLIAIIILSIATSGCSTTIGRLVTNITSGSAGTVNVERCELRREVWTGTFDVSNCETSTVGIR